MYPDIGFDIIVIIVLGLLFRLMFALVFLIGTCFLPLALQEYYFSMVFVETVLSSLMVLFLINCGYKARNHFIIFTLFQLKDKVKCWWRLHKFRLHLPRSDKVKHIRCETLSDTAGPCSSSFTKAQLKPEPLADTPLPDLESSVPYGIVSFRSPKTLQLGRPARDRSMFDRHKFSDFPLSREPLPLINPVREPNMIKPVINLIPPRQLSPPKRRYSRNNSRFETKIFPHRVSPVRRLSRNAPMRIFTSTPVDATGGSSYRFSPISRVQPGLFHRIAPTGIFSTSDRFSSGLGSYSISPFEPSSDLQPQMTSRRRQVPVLNLCNLSTFQYTLQRR